MGSLNTHRPSGFGRLQSDAKTPLTFPMHSFESQRHAYSRHAESLKAEPNPMGTRTRSGGADDLTERDVVVRFQKRAHNPLLLAADYANTNIRVPWLGGEHLQRVFG